MKALFAALGLVAGGIATGVFLLQSPRPAVHSGTVPGAESVPAVAEDAAAEMAAAQSQAPFDIRQPEWLPGGYELRRVSFDSDPGAPGGHAFSVDMKFVNPSDEVIHLWQTNLTPNQMGPTDPLALAESSPLKLGRATWLATNLAILDGVSRTQLAHRDGAGITITVDGPHLSDLRRVAESIAATQ